MVKSNRNKIFLNTLNIVRNQLVSFAAGFYLRKLRSLTGKDNVVKKILLIFLAAEAIIQSYWEIGNALQDELLFGTNDEKEGEYNE